MKPYSYDHHYNLHGIGVSRAYIAKSEYPYPQKQYAHYTGDIQSHLQDIGKIYAWATLPFLVNLEVIFITILFWRVNVADVKSTIQKAYRQWGPTFMPQNLNVPT